MKRKRLVSFSRMFHNIYGFGVYIGVSKDTKWPILIVNTAPYALIIGPHTLSEDEEGTDAKQEN